MLKPITPLGADRPETVTLGPVTIAEVVDVALASLAERRGADIAPLAQAAGVPLPGPGQAAAGAVYAAFWLSPGQWMVEAPFASHEDIVAALKHAFAEAASLTEQTDAWARFDVTCPDPGRLFERLCALDLARMAPGSATRTVIEHLGCYVIRRTGDRLSVLGPRSSAAGLFHALTSAAKAAF